MPAAESVTCEDVGDVPDGQLRAAQLLWASADSPWVHTADRSRNLATFVPLREMNPTLILSTHLPPAARRAPEFFSDARCGSIRHCPHRPRSASSHHHGDSIGSANGLHMRVVD